MAADSIVAEKDGCKFNGCRVSERESEREREKEREREWSNVSEKKAREKKLKTETRIRSYKNFFCRLKSLVFFTTNLSTCP